MLGRRNLFLLALLAALVLLGVWLIRNTSLELHGSSLQDGSLELETNFPGGHCVKVLSRKFPFIFFDCEQKSESEGSVTGYSAIV
jgi:hypothetical protein